MFQLGRCMGETRTRNCTAKDEEPLKAEDRVERNGLTSFSFLVLSLTGTPGQRMPTGQSPTPTHPYPLVLSIPSYAFNWTVLYRHVGDLVRALRGSRGFEEPDFGPQPSQGRRGTFRPTSLFPPGARPCSPSIIVTPRPSNTSF